MSLSPRERQVLRLLADGMTGKAAALKLAISQDTVKTYTEKARLKLRATTTTQAVVMATQRGLI